MDKSNLKPTVRVNANTICSAHAAYLNKKGQRPIITINSISMINGSLTLFVETTVV